MVNFGERLRMLRLSAGMSQSDLARELNLTKSVVSYYELRERTPSPEVLVKMSRIFHVTADYLLGIERRRVLDVSDLTEEDVTLLLKTIDTLRKKSSR